MTFIFLFSFSYYWWVTFYLPSTWTPSKYFRSSLEKTTADQCRSMYKLSITTKLQCFKHSVLLELPGFVGFHLPLASILFDSNLVYINDFFFWMKQREGIKPGTNARDPGPKSETKFCQQNIVIKHACIELKFGSNIDYRLFFEMHISIFLHLPYLYYMQVKYRTMSWNMDPGPTFSVLTMSGNS